MESRNISVEVHLNGTQKAKRSYSFLDQQEQYNREFRNTVKVEKNEENSSSSMIEETSEIQSEVQKEISPDYKGKKKAFVQSENETIPKPAKTPITAEIIIEENPPMASVYHNRYVHYQCDVDNLIKNGSNPSDIVYDNEGFIDINYIKSVKEDKNNEEINNINNVNDVELDALTEQTVHYLRKAWKISEEDIPSLKRDVKNVYIRRGEQALVTQKYYELQRDKKREWSAMKKFCSNIYYTLSIPTKHENRRNKKAITLLYGKEKRETCSFSRQVW